MYVANITILIAGVHWLASGCHHNIFSVNSEHPHARCTDITSVRNVDYGISAGCRNDGVASIPYIESHLSRLAPQSINTV